VCQSGVDNSKAQRACRVLPRCPCHSFNDTKCPRLGRACRVVAGEIAQRIPNRGSPVVPGSLSRRPELCTVNLTPRRIVTQLPNAEYMAASV
jgi:hypothetical protein